MQNVSTHYKPISTWQAIWLISLRQIKETLFSRRSLCTLGFALAFIIFEAYTSLEPTIKGSFPVSVKGTLIAVWLAWPVLINSTSVIQTSVYAFAGDKERGSLMPLLAAPVSNLAIFAGKILGSIVPACIFAAIGAIGYFAFLSIIYGTNILGVVQWGLAALVLVLALDVMLLGAAFSSIISSRAQKLQTAQAISSMISTVVIGVVLFGSLQLNTLGGWAYPTADATLLLLSVILIIVAATTWKREEVMARL